MTALSDVARRAFTSEPFAAPVTAVAVVVLFTVLLLIVEREIFRARSTVAAGRPSPPLSVVISPLLVVFAVFVAARFISLL